MKEVSNCCEADLECVSADGLAKCPECHEGCTAKMKFEEEDLKLIEDVIERLEEEIERLDKDVAKLKRDKI